MSPKTREELEKLIAGLEGTDDALIVIAVGKESATALCANASAQDMMLASWHLRDQVLSLAYQTEGPIQ